MDAGLLDSIEVNHSDVDYFGDSQGQGLDVGYLDSLHYHADYLVGQVAEGYIDQHTEGCVSRDAEGDIDQGAEWGDEQDIEGEDDSAFPAPSPPVRIAP